MAERFRRSRAVIRYGWNYWYNWTIILPAELSAAAVLINYWNKTINDAAWISICLVIVVLSTCSVRYVLNVSSAEVGALTMIHMQGVYGEAEFIFASIKVITITGLIILGIVLDLGGGPNHDRIGFRYWKNPGPFVHTMALVEARANS
ncbi:amino acid permease/ SLC12A domain-containing protein [Amylocystis lapponica]|nr:amino acid permease/ SLC12A domain-containing protein [Amylocystis lapponica]